MATSQSLRAQAKQRFRDIIWTYDTEPTEFWLGLVTLALGFWLLLPCDTFALGPGYRAMLALAPEPFWGLLWVAVGALHLVKLLTNGIHFRRQTAFLMVVLWLFQAVLIALGSMAGIGVAIYSTLALQAAWVYLRLGRV